MGKEGYLPQVRQAFPLLDRTTWQFGEKEDLTYKIIQDFQGDEIYAHRSIFTGTLLRNIVVRGGDFSRSDFDGARLESCRFEDVSFFNIDLRSTFLSNVTFVRCKFDNAYINASVFQDCILEECQFHSASLTKCKYSGCQFNGSDISMATSLLNHFTRCWFKDMSLGDCTFTLCFLIDCKYENVIFDISTLGSVYGLTIQDIIRFQYIFKGKIEDVPITDQIIDDVISEFVRRHWYLGASIMRLNYKKASVIQALREIYLTLVYFISNDLLVNKDEITFLKDILYDLFNRAALPYYSLIDLVVHLDKVLPKVLADAKYQNVSEELLLLKNSAHMLALRMADEFSRGVVCAHDLMRPAELEVVFNQKAQIPLDTIINELSLYLYEGNTGQATVLHDGPGSWKTCVRTVLGSALAFQFFLFTLNGCVIQITELKSRIKVLMDDSLAGNYLDMAKLPDQRIPPTLENSLNKVYDFTKDQEWLSDPALKGYGNSNIKSIKVR